MKRPLRRPAAENPAPLALALALEYEEGRAWPSGGDRCEFWSRNDVPAELRSTAEPDPRRVLEGPDGYAEYTESLEAWKARRLAWLREAAR